MAMPPSAELKRRWARANLGALIWFFFGLLLFLFTLRHHRISDWDWHTGPFVALYAGSAVCGLISCSLLTYAARSLKPRFTLRTLMVAMGLVAVVLAMVKLFLFDRWYYERVAMERAMALAREGDFDTAARIIDRIHDTRFWQDATWWKISRDLAGRGDAKGAVLALGHTMAGYTRDEWLKELALAGPLLAPAQRQEFLTTVRETMGPRTESMIRSYLAAFRRPPKPVPPVADRSPK